MRQLAADGSAVFHPDHQEIHLRNLGLRVQAIVSMAELAYRRRKLVTFDERTRKMA